jgi:fatty-acyl-CoA synthase
MDATMMNSQLTIDGLMDRAEQYFGEVEVVSQMPDKSLRRDTYADIGRRARRLAKGLQERGLEQGECVATLMWNHYAHLETYFGAPMAGGIYHTLNIRLSPDDLTYIVDNAEDRYLIVDDILLPLLQKFVDRIDVDEIFVVRMTDEPLPDGFTDYEDLLADEVGDWQPPQLDEDQGAGLCYTSGTTGKPKGVVYDHRSLVLHSLGSAMADTLAVTSNDTVLPVVPMFHANAWGLPFTCTMTGAKQVFPGPHLDGESLLDLYDKEEVTMTAGVPTIWLDIVQQLEKNPDGWEIQDGMRMVVGGAAAPKSMIEKFDEFDMEVVHAWGMTELTPLGTVSTLRPAHQDLSYDEQLEIRAKQGAAVPLVEIRAVDEEGEEVPWDGETVGELQVRGPWVADSYVSGRDADKWDEDNWFSTGDVVHIDEHGYIKITDRLKDVIKSGGEWISSQELENTLMAHPDVAEAAVFAVPHPKWSERPMAAVVFKEGRTVDDAEFNERLLEKYPKFWLPEEYVEMEEIPRTSTGKFQKSDLREQFSDWKPGEAVE